MSKELEIEEEDLGAELLGELPEDDEPTVPVIEDDEPAPALDDEPEEPAPTDEPEPEEEDVSVKLERAEKRVKDNQANFQKEHQERLRLQKELEELRAGTPRETPEVPSEEIDEDSFYDDPVAALKAMKEERRREIQALRDEQTQRELAQAEAVARTKHDDYDDVIDGFLVPEMTKNPALRDQWLSNGGDPETAYKMGKDLMEFRDYSDNPSAFKDRLREEIKQELDGKKPTIGRTLSSTPSARGKAQTFEDDDLLSDL